MKALQRIVAHASFARDGTSVPQANVLLSHFSAHVSKKNSGQCATFCAAGIACITLGNPRDENSHPLPIEHFVDRYREAGAAFAIKLTGAYAYVLFDEKNDLLLAGVDRMARVPLAFARTPAHGVAIATSTEEMQGIGELALRVDPQSIYDYVYFHMIPAPRTLYRGVARLAPGEQLQVRANDLRVVPAWQPQFNEHYPITYEDAKLRFRSGLESAVRDAVAEAQNVGTFLSGGTDSSTTTGLVAQVSGKPANAYSIGFDEEGYDETGYAKIAAKHFPVNHHIYYVTPQDVVDALPKVVEAYDQPFGNASAIPTYYCALRAQEDGITHMIAGDGGDELFGGNERYATQAKYSQWSDLPAALRAPVRGIASILSGVGPFGKVSRGIKVMETPMPARLQHYNLVNQIGANEMFTPEFLAQIDAQEPLALQAQIYDNTRANTQLNRMLALDWRITLADSDLPKVTSMCAQADMPVLYPMLDDRITDLSMLLPNDFKLKGQHLRWFFKEALRDFLPPEIITKSKHGFGLPFGHWLSKHDAMRQQAMAALESLKSRGIIRPQFIDALGSKIGGDGAGYYGTMVWVLTMLELWLQHHRVSLK